MRPRCRAESSATKLVIRALLCTCVTRWLSLVCFVVGRRFVIDGSVPSADEY
jgi:hypothetical protein